MSNQTQVALPNGELYGQATTDQLMLNAARQVAMVMKITCSEPEDYLIRQIVCAIEIYEAMRLSVESVGAREEAAA